MAVLNALKTKPVASRPTKAAALVTGCGLTPSEWRRTPPGDVGGLLGGFEACEMAERRKRVLDLDLDLSTLSKREEKMRRVAEDDPLLQKRSREDFVQCLRQVRGRIGSIQEEEFDDGLDLSGFVEKLKGMLDEVT
eukprot:s2038_g19.t1